MIVKEFCFGALCYGLAMICALIGRDIISNEILEGMVVFFLPSYIWFCIGRITPELKLKKPELSQYDQGYQAAMERIREGADPRVLYRQSHSALDNSSAWDRGWRGACDGET